MCSIMRAMRSSVETVRKAYHVSPIGILEVEGTEEAVLAVRFASGRKPRTSEWTPALEKCLKELAEYFAGGRKAFTAALRPQGTDFQRRVWRAVAEVAYGTTTTYGRVAREIGRPRAVRAVGAANGSNPAVILIPCHRVVRKGGDLTGYGSGLWRKEWLLAHERKFGGPASGRLFKE